MSKRIVNIPDRTYNFIMGLKQHTFGSKYAHKDVQADIVKAVKESKPYDDSGDLISRSVLKEKLQARHDNGEEDFDKGYNIGIEAAMDLIDSAQTVEYTFEEAFQKTVCENKLYCPAKLKDENSKILEQFAEIKKIVNDFISTRDVPLVEQAYSETNKIEKSECFDKILNILGGGDKE